MSDQIPEQRTISDAPSEPTPDNSAVGLPAAFTPMQVENFLTLDQIMNSARRSRRTAKICLAADLEAEYLTALDELGNLVDSDGNPLDQDASLGDTAGIATLRDQIKNLHDQMDAQTYPMLFEAMDSDAWETFDKKHRDPQGNIKNVIAWQNEMIATCAVNPPMSVDQVQAMRTKFSPHQMQSVSAAALSACQSGGVDVPKLPTFSVAPKPAESSLN